MIKGGVSDYHMQRQVCTNILINPSANLAPRNSVTERLIQIFHGHARRSKMKESLDQDHASREANSWKTSDVSIHQGDMISLVVSAWSNRTDCSPPRSKTRNVDRFTSYRF